MGQSVGRTFQGTPDCRRAGAVTWSCSVRTNKVQSPTSVSGASCHTGPLPPGDGPVRSQERPGGHWATAEPSGAPPHPATTLATGYRANTRAAVSGRSPSQAGRRQDPLHQPADRAVEVILSAGAEMVLFRQLTSDLRFPVTLANIGRGAESRLTNDAEVLLSPQLPGRGTPTAGDS